MIEIVWCEFRQSSGFDQTNNQRECLSWFLRYVTFAPNRCATSTDELARLEQVEAKAVLGKIIWYSILNRSLPHFRSLSQCLKVIR